MDPITTQLDYGTSGPEVKKLQEFLMSQGFDIPFGATGNFFDETLAALQAYQTAKGIVSSGDEILLEETDYKRLKEAMDVLEGLSKSHIEFVTRVFEAEEVEIEEKKVNSK